MRHSFSVTVYCYAKIWLSLDTEAKVIKTLLLFESRTNASNFRPEGSRPWNLCTSASNSLSVIPYDIDLANDCKQKGVLVSPIETKIEL